MELIAVLLALWLRRFVVGLDTAARRKLLHDYVDWLEARLGKLQINQPKVRVLAIAIPVLVLVYLAQWMAEDAWFGIVTVALSVALLLVSFGPGSLDDEVEDFEAAWYRQDWEEAEHYARMIAPYENIPENQYSLPRIVCEQLFFEANRRVFAVIFWFVLLGPMGAVGFRFFHLIYDYWFKSEEPKKEAAESVLYALEWLPARITAIGYAIAGSFTDALDGWHRLGDHWQHDNRGVLIGSGLGALKLKHHSQFGLGEVTDARDLLTRTIIVWVAVLALLMLAGI